jgi:hypothetical protein
MPGNLDRGIEFLDRILRHNPESALSDPLYKIKLPLQSGVGVWFRGVSQAVAASTRVR